VTIPSGARDFAAWVVRPQDRVYAVGQPIGAQHGGVAQARIAAVIKRDPEIVEPCGQLLLFCGVGLAQLGAARSIRVVVDLGVLHVAKPFLDLKPLGREASPHFFHPIGHLRERDGQDINAALSRIRLRAIRGDPREDRSVFLFKSAAVHLSLARQICSALQPPSPVRHSCELAVASRRRRVRPYHRARCISLRRKLPESGNLLRRI
jgi:hypothetical protein